MTQQPLMKDGQALDRLMDRAERWAASYPKVGDRDAWDADYDAKFRREAEQLAQQSTLPAREFRTKDWILAVLLWLIIAGGVLASGAAAIGAAVARNVIGADHLHTTASGTRTLLHGDKEKE